MSLMKVSTYSAPDAVIAPKTGQPENEGHDSLDSFIRQAIGKEPFFSFTRSGESPIQWIQLLHALDQQGNGKVSKGSLSDHMVEGNDQQHEDCNGISTFSSKINGLKMTGNSTKGCGAPAEVTRSSSEHMQTLKIPEAVVALAQAAAKANGEPEKYLPGWPLLSPSKVLLQKCDKCSREFCSPINYRRHIRVHRRSLNADKVSPKTKELLGTFWDKLSLEEAKELASFEDVKLEEVAGSSIIWALTSFLRKPGFSSLPQVYLKAGATLLDIVQGRPSRFPISSQELFSILDDASEKTFLCAGTAISLQRFVFDREVGKIAMEMKNLVACTSFLLEQKLIKAWLADKDAEALRCQKLLFEEEEASQKRQADILERKRMKKLRQKEQKTKQLHANKPGPDGGLSDLAEGTSCSMETDSSMEPSEMDPRTTKSPVCSSHPASEPTHSSNPCMVVDGTCSPETWEADQKWEYKIQQGSTQRLPTLPRRPTLKQTKNYLNGFHPQISVVKSVSVQKHSGYRDLKSSSLVNSQKVWTRKSKPEDDEDDQKSTEKEKEMRNKTNGITRCEVLIGSISVDLEGRDGLHENLIPVGQESVQEGMVLFDSTLSAINESVKLLKQMDREEDGISGTLKSENKESSIGGLQSLHTEASSWIPQDESCLANGGMGECMFEMTRNSLLVSGSAGLLVPQLFSSKVAKAFLSERWKEATSANHTTLVLSPDSEGGLIIDDDNAREESQTGVKLGPVHCSGRTILGNAENRIARTASGEQSSTVIYRSKRMKPENGYKLKYIPKQRNNV